MKTHLEEFISEIKAPYLEALKWAMRYVIIPDMILENSEATENWVALHKQYDELITNRDEIWTTM